MVTADDDSSGKFAVFSEYTCQPYSYTFFSSAVPSGRGAFQMPTRPWSAAASALRGGRANLRNASVTFSLFFGMKLLWDDINNIS